jgi:hypothetical protein
MPASTPTVRHPPESEPDRPVSGSWRPRAATDYHLFDGSRCRSRAGHPGNDHAGCNSHGKHARPRPPLRQHPRYGRQHPLIRVNNLRVDGRTIYAKGEFFNPASSAKDRLAFNVIEKAALALARSTPSCHWRFRRCKADLSWPVKLKKKRSTP